MTRNKAAWRTVDQPRPSSQVAKLGEYKRGKVKRSRQIKGLPGSIPVERVRDHINYLRSIGFGDVAIASAAGVAIATIHTIRHRETGLCQIPVGMRILAVGHVPVPEQRGTKVPAIGTARRIHALQAIGWSNEELGKRLGVGKHQVGSYTLGTVNYYDTWEAVAKLYEELSATPGPSEWSRKRARTKGYAPPLAWEGVDIDDPRQEVLPMEDATDSHVDEVLVQRILRGEHRGDIPKPERTAVLDHAVEHGWSKSQVAEALNLSVPTADAALVRHRRKARQEEAAA